MLKADVYLWSAHRDGEKEMPGQQRMRWLTYRIISVVAIWT